MYLKDVAEEGDEEEKIVISGHRPFLWSCDHSLFPSRLYTWKEKRRMQQRPAEQQQPVAWRTVLHRDAFP